MKKKKRRRRQQPRPSPGSSLLARQEPFIPVLRELARAWQAFLALDAHLLQDADLTVPQADILFTLGNTAGMTCRELGARTLTSKGTLTGIIDRLAARGLVHRQPSPDDGRSTLILLTPAGTRLFEDVYPRHIAAFKERFDRLGSGRLTAAGRSLRELRELFL
jgi:DNA-binding MarR family transcriptional regulator